jgi:hypothetical protein
VGHEHALPPPSLHIPIALQILDDPCNGIGVDAQEAGQLADAGQCLVPWEAAALDEVLELFRQLTADRDWAVIVHMQLHRASFVSVLAE